jgi:hypothetical protein
MPNFDVSRAVANLSLGLEHLSASFIVDAGDFFYAREPSWKWPNLTSLALTSRLLAPNKSPAEIGYMLQATAAAAMEMPNLETMEIWNGQEGLAMLFRFQSARGGRPSTITLRGTWELELRPAVTEAWEAVTLRHGGQGLVIAKELLGPGIVVKSHGAAIHYLRLSSMVIRPIALRQIRIEHRIRGAHNYGIMLAVS